MCGLGTTSSQEPVPSASPHQEPQGHRCLRAARSRHTEPTGHFLWGGKLWQHPKARTALDDLKENNS